MTNRFSYPDYWAEDGDAVDPDLDTTNPNYVEDKYEKEGWVAQKPPEEWQNFLSQISDVKIIDWMQDGIQQYDESVVYSIGSICSLDGEFYKLTSAQPVPPKAPTDATSGFSKILSKSSSEYQALVDSLRDLIANHLAANNPHKDTVDTLTDGGYIKTAIDNFFGSATDPKTIVYHKAQRGQAVHKETVTQIGTLPTSGGTFTGDVSFASDAIMSVTPSKMFHYNKATALLELVNGTMALGIDSSGKCFVVNSTGQSQVISEELYTQTEIMYNGKFALPIPIIQAHIRQSISDADSVGFWTIETTSDPVFDSVKGFRFDNNDTNIRIRSIGGPVTVYIRCTLADGTKQALIKDLNNWTIHPNTENFAQCLSAGWGITNGQYMEEYTVYPQLSAYQKSMLTPVI